MKSIQLVNIFRIARYTISVLVLLGLFWISNRPQLIAELLNVQLILVVIVFLLHFVEKYILKDEINTQGENSKSMGFYGLSAKTSKWFGMISDIIGLVAIIWIVLYLLPRIYGPSF